MASKCFPNAISQSSRVRAQPCGTVKAGNTLIAPPGWVSPVSGHANPKVAAALAEQAGRLITCPGVFYNDVRAKLLDKLVTLTPEGLNRVFLCNSGTEANEAAIKFARHSTGKTQFVCAMRGFHGRTMGALSATHKHRNQFEPLIPGFSFVPFNNIDKLEAALSDDTAAVILEIVQGEGGVRVGEQTYFDAAQALCKQHHALLIIDEIQTGFCRTGAMFACEHFGVSPDMMCLAKAMAGGVPMGGGGVQRRGKGRHRHARHHVWGKPPRRCRGTGGD